MSKSIFTIDAFFIHVEINLCWIEICVVLIVYSKHISNLIHHKMHDCIDQREKSVILYLLRYLDLYIHILFKTDFSSFFSSMNYWNSRRSSSSFVMISACSSWNVSIETMIFDENWSNLSNSRSIFRNVSRSCMAVFVLRVIRSNSFRIWSFGSDILFVFVRRE